MSKGNKRGYSRGWLAFFIPMALIDLGLLIYIFIFDKNIALIHAKGLIAQEQLNLLIFSSIVLFAAAVPTVLVLYFVAWKYRESNTKATHEPNAKHSKLFVFGIWAFPTIIMLILLPVMYFSTHKLEPRKAIAADTDSMTIQVIATRWKWVFLYPEQQIATVNFVQLPLDTPVTFELTADEAPMSSFWIPNLGGQLYAMTSHINKLNLVADKAGDYPGIWWSAIALLGLWADDANAWAGKIFWQSLILLSSFGTLLAFDSWLL